MKTTEFIDALESLHILPNDILFKLRGKIEKTDKDVSAKSVAKYLIDKGYLSKFQAKQILAGATKGPGKQQELDLQVPQQQVDDTDELLKDLQPAGNPRTESEPASQPPQPNVTQPDGPGVVEAHDPSIEVVDVDIEQTIQQGFENADPVEGVVAGFDDGFGDDFESGTASVKESALEAFQGKKAKKNQWDSRWLFIGSTVLALLLIVGSVLAFTIFAADSAKLWEEAVQAFNNSNYQVAKGKLDEYVQKFPGDENFYKAKVMIVNCELRIPYESGNWATALTQSQKVLPVLEEELNKAEKTEELADLRPELSVILPATAIGFTEQGLDAADVEIKKERLKLADATMELIDNPSYLPGSEKRKPAVDAQLKLLKDNLSKIRRQIRMEKEYVTALDTMKQLTESGNTSVAFQVYEQLVGIYPELRTREGLQDSLVAISVREADLVETIGVDFPLVEPKETAIQSSVIFATNTGRRGIGGLSSEMLVHLINGSIYGLRARDGHAVWRKYVGVETRQQPIWVEEPNKSDAIVVDGSRLDLIRLNSRTGAEVWRINIGEPFAQPNVTPAGILVTTFSGKVCVVDLESGKVSKAAQVPKETRVSPVMIGRAPFIYQLAVDSNLYVISTETMTCREVFFLGHDTGSVAVAPLVVSGHMIIPVNAANYCNLNVLRQSEDGVDLERAQVPIRMTGKVTTPLLGFKGRSGIVLSDSGELKMIEVIQGGGEDDPVQIVVEQKVSSGRQARNYMNAADGQLWLAGAGLRRFKIQKAARTFRQENVTNNLDLFAGNSSYLGDTLFHVRRRHQSSLVSVSAVDPVSLEQIWRTDLGAPLAGPPIASGNQIVVVSAQGDVFPIDDESVNQGAANRPSSRASNVLENLVFSQLISLPGKYAALGPLDRKSLLTIDLNQQDPSSLTDLRSPADKLSCSPIALGENMLVPTVRGQVFRVNVQTGEPIGAPFQPALAPNTTTTWRRPFAISNDRFIIGDETGKIFLVETNGPDLQKLGELEADGKLLSHFIGIDGASFGVIRNEDGDQIIQLPHSDSLEISSQFDLPAGYVAGPFALTDKSMVVLLDSGETVCVNSSLEQQWFATLPPNGNDALAGEPVIRNGMAVFAFQSGTILTINPDDGKIAETLDVGQPIAFPPVEVDGRYFVTGADGVLHLLTGLAPKP